jgi:DNA-binding NarL/FixJ family response regulator
MLSRLDGETQKDEGGQVLRLRDPFLRRSHAPVEVTVEAKDNDPLSGPKWGASAAITVVPPDVGEPEAKRLAALRRVRDALVDALAWRTSEPAADRDRAKAAAHGADESKRATADERVVDDALAQTSAGVPVPTRTRALLSAQRAKLRSAVDAEVRAPNGKTHDATVAATERFVLVVDATIRGLAVRQTRDAARQLADVAEDLVSGAAQAQADAAEVRSRAAGRMDVDGTVLRAGARNLRTFGATGRDIGEIVAVDCGRVDRARAAPDPAHAELAARDLAARLHQPDPSFGSRGSSRGGGESGGGRGTEEDEGAAPDDVEQAFDEAKGDLDRLSQDHAGAVGKTEQLLAGAQSEEEQNGLRDEARRHAQAIRDAARPLPAVGGGSDSWTSKGAAARELAEQAARSLEEARPDEAAQAGRSAVTALEDAKRMLEGRRGRGWLDDPDSPGDPRKLEESAKAIEAEARWAEEQVKRLRAAAAQRSRGQLERGGQEEDEMANRARELAQRSRERGSLPQDAIEAIDDAERAAREAAGALKEGDAERGLDRQHQAQRDLEAARARLQDDSEKDEGEPRASSSDDDGRRGPSAAPVDIPRDHKGPEDFRRRVVRGLGQASSGSLKDAVQRYAEGLLR